MFSESNYGDSSSDSNLNLDSDVENQDYLHEKIGIYVKDHSGSAQDKSQLIQLLPVEFGVVIVSYSDEKRYDLVPGFSCTLRLSIWDKETILRWLKLFEQKTCTVWRVDSTFKCDKSKKLIFKKNFRCQNNQYNHPNRNKEITRKKRVEHTACPAKLSLTIKNHGMQRTSDIYLKDYPTVINIRFAHNHTFSLDKEISRCLKSTKSVFSDVKHLANNYGNKLNENDIDNEIPKISEEDEKCAITTDWNSIIICDDDVFNERVSQSPCLRKESENVNFGCSEMSPFIDRICNVLKEKLVDKPDMYHLPVLNFIESFNNLKTDTQLVAALNSFAITNNSGACKKECFNVDDGPICLNIVQNNKSRDIYKEEKEDRIYIDTSSEFYKIT